MRLGTAAACSCQIRLLRLSTVYLKRSCASVSLADLNQLFRIFLRARSCQLLRHIFKILYRIKTALSFPIYLILSIPQPFSIFFPFPIHGIILNLTMGQCQTCNREAEYNAVDSDDLMTKLQHTQIGNDIAKIRSDNRESIVNFKFMPMPDKSFFKGKLNSTTREGYGQNYAGCFNYFGFYKNDLPHGQGAIITEKQCLVGHFEGGVLNGKGKEWSDEVTFQGTYRNGQRIQGKLSSDEISYIGQFKNELFHGKGTLIQNKKFTYEGQFAGGKFNGQGTITFEGGCKYKGGFKNGLYQGYGEFHWPNGNFYRGEYKAGRRDGFGVLHIGTISYQGNWKNGVRDGHGILVHPPDMAFGTWHNNLLIQQ